MHPHSHAGIHPVYKMDGRNRGTWNRGGSLSFMLMSCCLQAASEVLPGYRPRKQRGQLMTMPPSDWPAQKLCHPGAPQTCDSQQGRWNSTRWWAPVTRDTHPGQSLPERRMPHPPPLQAGSVRGEGALVTFRRETLRVIHKGVEGEPWKEAWYRHLSPQSQPSNFFLLSLVNEYVWGVLKKVITIYRSLQWLMNECHESQRTLKATAVMAVSAKCFLKAPSPIRKWCHYLIWLICTEKKEKWSLCR